jgi:hypothetical protein
MYPQDANSRLLALLQRQRLAMGPVQPNRFDKSFLIVAVKEADPHVFGTLQPERLQAVHTVDHRHRAPVNNNRREVLTHLSQHRDVVLIGPREPG